MVICNSCGAEILEGNLFIQGMCGTCWEAFDVLYDEEAEDTDDLFI